MLVEVFARALELGPRRGPGPRLLGELPGAGLGLFLERVQLGFECFAVRGQLFDGLADFRFALDQGLVAPGDLGVEVLSLAGQGLL